MHNGQLHNLCCSQNIIQLTKLRNEIGVACSGHGRMRYVKHFSQTTYRELTTWDTYLMLQWVLDMTCCNSVNLINLAQDRSLLVGFLNKLMNFRIPQTTENSLTS
jgi:hypothetical protein